MRKAATIKRLETTLRDKQSELAVLNAEIASKQKEYVAKKLEVSELMKKLQGFRSKGDLSVTEHAMLRYLERVKGMDLTAVESEIISEELLKFIALGGTNATYMLGDYNVVIKDNVIVTITTKQAKEK